MGEGECTVHTLSSYQKRIDRNNHDDSKLLFISTPCVEHGSAVKEAVFQALAETPSLFQHTDLLSLPRPIRAGSSRTMSQLYFGRAQCYSAMHVDYLATSTGSLLVSGEKLWLYGRPEQRDVFFQAFPPEKSISWTKLNLKASRQVMDTHHFGVIHQRAGDLLYLPAGWPHAVYHATNNVMLAFSMLHPWNVPRFIEQISGSVVHEWLDFDAVMDAYVTHSHKFGISTTAAKSMRKQYREAKSAAAEACLQEEASEL